MSRGRMKITSADQLGRAMDKCGVPKYMQRGLSSKALHDLVKTYGIEVDITVVADWKENYQ